MRIGVALGAIYLATVLFNFGAFNADMQWRCQHELTNTCAVGLYESYRSQAGVAAAFALAGPVTLPAAVFATGFMEHGWRLTVGPVP